VLGNGRSIEHDVGLDAPKGFAADALDPEEIFDGAKLREPLPQRQDGASPGLTNAWELHQLFLGGYVENDPSVGEHPGSRNASTVARCLGRGGDRTGSRRWRYLRRSHGGRARVVRRRRVGAGSRSDECGHHGRDESNEGLRGNRDLGRSMRGRGTAPHLGEGGRTLESASRSVAFGLLLVHVGGLA